MPRIKSVFAIYLLIHLISLSALMSNESNTFSYWWPWRATAPIATPPEETFHLNDILNLEETLSNRVIGQPYAVRAVADVMLAYSAKIHDKNKPIGCFLFIGSTGVGKTELAKALAKEIASDPSQFVRLNMSEFNNDRQGLDRLIGMPWGYKESEKGGELSSAILKHPYAVVLLDEFEKADEKVRFLFLHIFDEGYFTSAKGEYVDCKNCIFIATTNLGTDTIKYGYANGWNYDEIMYALEPILNSRLTPELYNRMEPVLFQTINNYNIKKIIHLKLEELTKRIYDERRIRLFFDSSVVDYLSSHCYHLDSGARPILNTINKDVLRVITKFLIKNHPKENDEVFISYDGETLVISSL